MFSWFIIGIIFLLGGEKSTISQNEIQQVITHYVTDYLDTASNEIVIEFRSVPESVIIEKSNYSLSVSSSVNIPSKGYAGIPVQIYTNGKLIRTVICSAMIRRFEDVCVITRDLEKNDVIQPFDIKIQRMETTNFDNDVIISLISAVNTRTKRMIKANTVLKNSMIEEIPAVNYNDKVVVVVKTKNLSIAASGTARQEGKIGEEVRIQREGSREFLSAKVVGKQTVEIIVR